MCTQSSFSKSIIWSGILLLSISPVFAAAVNCDPNSMTEQLTTLLNRVLALLSRLWIPFAMFAGKLMGNGFVYGEFFNLDKVLYFLWNMSRTFANFFVVVLIIGELIEQFGSGGIEGSKMMKYILKIWWGILLANMSWFLIGATVDISTVLTTTVGALPGTYIAQDNKAQETIELAIKNAQLQSKQTIHMTTTQCDGKPTVTFENKDNIMEQKSTEEIMDMILPKENSISWPLLYLGIGVLKLQDFLNTTNIPDDNITHKLFVVSTRVAISLVFMIALIVLVMINIIRIVAVRFFVCFAPLLILLQFTKDKGKAYQTGLLEKFTIPNIIKSIFAPVVAVGLMSIGLIVIVIMQWFLQLDANEITIDDIIIKSSWAVSSIGVDGIFESSMAGDLFGQNTGNIIKNTFSNILLIVFTLFILYGIIKALAWFLEKGIGGEFINKAVTLWTNALWSIPMIPLPWAGLSSLNSVKNIADQWLNKFKNKISSDTRDQDTAIQNMFRDKLDMDLLPYSDTYKWLQDLTTKFETSKTGISKSDYESMIKEFTKTWWVQWYYKGTNKTISNLDSSTSTLKTFFKNMDNRTISSLWLKWNITSWKETDTVETFINWNYINNKEFFNNLYQKLWWDISTLQNTTDKWKIFRTTSLAQSKE